MEEILNWIVKRREVKAGEREFAVYAIQPLEPSHRYPVFARSH